MPLKRMCVETVFSRHKNGNFNIKIYEPDK